MKAPAGAVVRIYVDLVASVDIGDIIQTEAGRAYRVLGVRVRGRGKHRGRQHLSCLVLGSDDAVLVDPTTTSNHIHKIRWYSRTRRAA